MKCENLDGSVGAVNGWLLNDLLSIPVTGREFSSHRYPDRTWGKPGLLSLVQRAETLFAAWGWVGVGLKRSDREADYFHSGPSLRMRSDLLRCGMRKRFKARLLWRNAIVDITSLYFAHTPFVQLSQQTLIVDPASHKMHRGSSDVWMLKCV